MSCDAAAAIFMLFAANTQPISHGPYLVRVADTASPAATVNFSAEPLFVDIVRRAAMLNGQVSVYREALAADGANELEAFGLFQGQIKELSDLDFRAHKSLEERGLDSDLKCILRGISADLTLKMGELSEAADAKAKDKALKEMSYLLNDNVEVIKAPPAPPV